MTKRYDVLVIGGGPSGYVAAIRAAQLGLSTACIESAPYDDPGGEVRLGGTCLNVGCIPSKALLQSTEHFENARHGFVMHGISVGEVSIDVRTMIRRKNNIVTQLASGIKGLFRKNKVTLLSGHGRFVAGGDAGWVLEVAGESVVGTHVIVATGAKPRQIEGSIVDNELICDNAGALAFEAVPKRLGVIGAGVIGLELGSVWKRLGAEVTLLEAQPEFLTVADTSVAREAWKVFTQRQGLDIRLGVNINEVVTGNDEITLKYEVAGENHVLVCDKLIVAVGRTPNTDGLGASNVGLLIDERGRIAVDDQCRTNLPNVWAIGDVVRGPMLAHKGMEEGVMVAELIAGQVGQCNYDAIPWVIYTHPEIAWVGKTEQQLKSARIEYRAGIVPFLGSGRALGQGDTTGFVKMLADAKTDRILGVHTIGAHASELISEAVVAMEFQASTEDIARIVHAHPTLSEMMHEAALATEGRALHF